MSKIEQNQSVSRKVFEARQRSHLDKFERNDGGFRNHFLWLAGSEERAREFLNPKGVAIGAFSQMVNLPISTVRHYIRLGLIEPWIVDGKYRFDPVNLMQLESVRQWIELGLTLEQILARKAEQRTKRPGIMVQDVLGPLRLSDEVLDKALVDIERIYDPKGYTENGHVSSLNTQNMTPEVKAFWNPEAVLADLRQEYGRLLASLKQKHLDLEQRIARAGEIEQELAKAM